MSQPQTVGDVEILLGSDATKLLSFRKEGDTVYAKPKAYIQDREVFLDILRRCKDIG